MAFTFEEWEKGYNDDRPIEPCCASENPEQWAEIAGYAEDKLKEAFDAGYQSCRKEYGRHFLKDGNKGKKEPFPRIDISKFITTPSGQVIKEKSAKAITDKMEKEKEISIHIKLPTACYNYFLKIKDVEKWIKEHPIRAE